MREVEKYTFITGSTRGIGYAVAEEFAKRGNNLILHGRDEILLREIQYKLKNKYKISIKTLKIDLRDNNLCKEVEIFIEKENLFIENFVNNAGVGSFGYFDDIDISKDISIIDVNISALTKLLKVIVLQMKKQGFGRICNVASTAAFTSGPKMAVYYASKAYVLNLSKGLRREISKDNIEVTCLCPGATDTDFIASSSIKKSESAKKNIINSSLVARSCYTGIMKNKKIIVPGFKNKILVFFSRLIPDDFIINMVYKANGGK